MYHFSQIHGETFNTLTVCMRVSVCMRACHEKSNNNKQRWQPAAAAAAVTSKNGVFLSIRTHTCDEERAEVV